MKIEKTLDDGRRARVWGTLTHGLYDSVRRVAYSLYDTRRSTEAPVLLVELMEPSKRCST